MIFGERIKQLRVENKWTQEFVSEKLNISMGALSRYETGMYEPKSLDLIKDFANLFNVSTDYLLGKSDIRNPEENNDFRYASNNGIDIDGLSDAEIKEIQDYVNFKRNMKNKKEK